MFEGGWEKTSGLTSEFSGPASLGAAERWSAMGAFGDFPLHHELEENW